MQKQLEIAYDTLMLNCSNLPQAVDSINDIIMQHVILNEQTTSKEVYHVLIFLESLKNAEKEKKAATLQHVADARKAMEPRT